jgi:hypothetical protein
MPILIMSFNIHIERKFAVYYAEYQEKFNEIKN